MTAIELDSFVVHDARFEDVLGESPRLVKVVDTDAHEGPVYVAKEDALYFSTVPRGREAGSPQVDIKRLALDGVEFPLGDDRIKVLRTRANAVNGMTLGRDGRLVVCEQGTLSGPACISHIDQKTGAAQTATDAFDGHPLNSPNDVVVTRDGAIWFTDPSYGHLQGFRPAPVLADSVYRHDPVSGETQLVASGFDKPNGLVFSPDERVLYVSDNGAPHHLLAFAVDDGANVGRGRVLAVGTPEHPDGLKVDAKGRIYASASAGVQVLDPEDGELLGEIVLPGAVNFCFGGPDHNVLFITADTAVYAAVLNAKGARP
ncbi:MAG TPA: SMP-30/gluconolactonase/LRE family protein [Gaiellaceae bacterium]|nr:SMP-30/gluconolactonase/LRE family protein [Gaiellaceae bacterium]